MKTKRKMSSMERREERTGFLFLLPSFIGFAVFILSLGAGTFAL